MRRTPPEHARVKRPDPSLLRVSLKTFLGEVQYRKFLEAGVREPLQDWQEQAWQKFIERYPQLEVTATERLDALDVCPVHECALLRGFTESRIGVEIDLAPCPERSTLFPCAPLLGLKPEGLQLVRYCPECIAAQEEFFRQRRGR
jgi:hypothetical protein